MSQFYNSKAAPTWELGRRNENCAGAAVFYHQYTSSCVNVNTRSVGIINSPKSNQEV